VLTHLLPFTFYMLAIGDRTQTPRVNEMNNRLGYS
jgi:hypothetical protein